MPKQYKIRDGFTFRGDDGQLSTGGDTIELEDDVAAQHAHKLELIEAPKRRSQSKSPAPTPTQDAGTGVTSPDAQDAATDDQGAAQADQPADQQ